MEIQQSPIYAAYIRSLHWNVVGNAGKYFYIKTLPLLGGILKIQRVESLPSVSDVLEIIKQYRIHTIAIEPDSSVSHKSLQSWLARLPPKIRKNTDYFLPTKTIRISLTSNIEKIFNNFSEAKRRAVRRAQKNTITIYQSNDIKTFVRMKNKSAGFLGSITTYGIDKLWSLCLPKNAMVLLAKSNHETVVGGILLLFWDNIAYYWIAGASKEGKKLFAPTLLVWEALKLAKEKKCRALDFVGVWDERLPQKNLQWKGFTKFKEGFGGTALYYPITDP